MILKRTLKAFEGMDINLETCIKEGYFFKINDTYCTSIPTENNRYYFEYNSNIGIFDYKYEIKRLIENKQLDRFLNFLGYDSYKEYSRQNTLLNKLSDVQSYSGVLFQFYEYSDAYSYTEIVEICNNLSKKGV